MAGIGSQKRIRVTATIHEACMKSKKTVVMAGAVIPPRRGPEKGVVLPFTIGEARLKAEKSVIIAGAVTDSGIGSDERVVGCLNRVSTRIFPHERIIASRRIARPRIGSDKRIRIIIISGVDTRIRAIKRVAISLPFRKGFLASEKYDKPEHRYST